MCFENHNTCNRTYMTIEKQLNDVLPSKSKSKATMGKSVAIF